MIKSRPIWTKTLLRVIVFLPLVFSLSCGGGLSQDDMKRMGIRRKKDPEPTAEVVQTSTPQSPQDLPAQTKPRPESGTTAEEPKSTSQISDSASPSDNVGNDSAKATVSLPTSDRRYPPKSPLSLRERLRLSANNLERIGQALEAYRRDKGKYPPRAIYEPSGTPFLSWRVGLLPYLGYADLYRKFHIDKPWSYPANKELLEHIPAVFQSPERFDNRTNYLLVVGSTTMFPGPRTVSSRRIEDGMENTLMVVEVDDDLAVTWTKPTEYEFEIKKPWRGLGKLRQGKVFVLWGEGLTGAVPSHLSTAQFSAMFTVDGGEEFSSFAVSKPLDDELFATYGAIEISADSPTDGQNKAAVSGSASQVYQGINSPNASQSLTSSYTQAAEFSAANFQPSDALLWYNAANIVQSAGTGWDAAYRWVPALRRPSSAIHFCVGALNEKREDSAVRSSTRRGADPEREKIVKLITDVGEQLLEVIEAESANLMPSTLSSFELGLTSNANNNSRSRSKPRKLLPVTFLEGDSRSELLRESVAKAGDVLVLFEIVSPPAGDRSVLSCDLIDVARRKEIVRLPHIRWQKENFSVENLERDEDFRNARWELKDAFEDTLVFEDWPSAIKSRHVQARLESLAKNKSLNPIVALAEMCVYRNRNFIDNKQLLDGYRALLGDEDGETLMLGSDKKRKRILRNWLPAEDFEELQNQAQDRRGRNKASIQYTVKN